MNTTLRQDLEAIASEMIGDRTAAGIATIALNKLVDNDTELAALRVENARLNAEVERLTEALTWYANEKHYEHPEDGHMTFRSVVDMDEGELARTTLKLKK